MIAGESVNANIYIVTSSFRIVSNIPNQSFNSVRLALERRMIVGILAALLIDIELPFESVRKMFKCKR